MFGIGQKSMLIVHLYVLAGESCGSQSCVVYNTLSFTTFTQKKWGLYQSVILLYHSV